MTSKAGLCSLGKTVTMAMLAVIMCVTICNANFNADDPIVWRKMDMAYVSGQVDYDLKLTFHNPCQVLFSNLTGIPRMDKILISTCNHRFNQDILYNLALLKNINEARTSREATVATITAVTALYFATYKIIDQSNERERIKNLENMTDALDRQLSTLQQKVVISNDRLSTVINNIERDIALLGSTSEAQAGITDALL